MVIVALFTLRFLVKTYLSKRGGGFHCLFVDFKTAQQEITLYSIMKNCVHGHISCVKSHVLESTMCRQNFENVIYRVFQLPKRRSS